MILGVDEVGRGAWAGPLVVGACVLPGDHQISGLTDSKKLTAKKRQAIFDQLQAANVSYGLGWVWPEQIDEIGLSAALKQATYEAVSQIKSNYDQIIVDGTINFLADYDQFDNVSTLKKADLLVPSVSAAAILAKVSRDQYMIDLTKNNKYEKYQFDKHVGYGTSLHRQMLDKYGVSEIHRRSFKPIAKMLNQKEETKNISGTAKDKGNWGEQVALDYLIKQNYQLLAQNWRTKLFEIDLVMEKGQAIYLVEVKTRKNNDFGGGVVAIDRQKIDKMVLAAKTIVQKYRKGNLLISSLCDWRSERLRSRSY